MTIKRPKRLKGKGTERTRAIRAKSCQPIEKSAGAIVFSHSESLEYLVLFSTFWEFPKGRVESDETEPAAAVREVREETGLDVELLEGFRQEVSYFHKREGSLIEKHVVYFLGRSNSRSFKLSWEHNDAKWLSYDAAVVALKYENLSKMLRLANEFLVRRTTNGRSPTQ